MSGFTTRYYLDEKSKAHKYLQHYCCLNTLNYIFRDKTLKLNNLKNVNDKHEVRRRGIENFAESTFVSCFCHDSNEIVPFWINYGDCKKNQKVMIKLPKLISQYSNDINSILYSDYFLTSDNNKMFFNSQTGLFPLEKTIESGIDIINCMSRFEIVDIIYKPIDDDVFNRNYYLTEHEDIPFRINGPGGEPIPFADTNTLGKYKTYPWQYEKETRILGQLLSPEKIYEYILLRLKNTFFMDMEIIINPWANDDFSEKIKRIIDDSDLSQEIKDSIKIKKSELHGTIK